MNKKKTHCRRGHPLSGDNLYIEPNGNRACKECRRIRSAKWHRENKHLRKARPQSREARAKAINPDPKQIYFDARVRILSDGTKEVL